MLTLLMPLPPFFSHRCPIAPRPAPQDAGARATRLPRAATSPSAGLASLDRSASRHCPDARAAGGIGPQSISHRPVAALGLYRAATQTSVIAPQRGGALIPMPRHAGKSCGAIAWKRGIGTSVVNVRRLRISEGTCHGVTPTAEADSHVLVARTRGGGGPVEGHPAAPFMNVAAFPALAFIRNVIPLEVIPAMAQTQGLTCDLAEEAGGLAGATADQKKRLIRIFSRDGFIDEEEMEVLLVQDAHEQALHDHENALYQKADNEAFAFSLAKNGRRSGYVRRQARQIFPSDPEAA